MVFPNNALMLNMFSWLAEKLIGGFFSVIMTIVNVVIEVTIAILSQVLYFIGMSLLTIVNFIQSLVRKLVGLDTYWWNGQRVEDGQDPVLRLVADPRVQQVFFGMLIVALVVLIISTFVQIIRLEYTTEGAQNTKGKLFGKAVKALAMFLIVPIGTTLGIFVGNRLLSALDKATNPSGSAYISGAIFMASATDANRVMDWDGNESGAGWIDVAKEYISLSALHDKAEIKEEGGRLTVSFTYTASDVSSVVAGTEDVAVVFTSNRGNLAEQKVDIANQIDDAFANGQNGLDFMNVKHVSGFYKLTDINYLVLFAAAVMVLYVLFNVVFGLILRLYKVAIYFMISPPIIALMPIYENAFTEWRKAIVGTVISAYGAVVGLNLFIMMLPILKNIQLFDPSSLINRGLNSYTYLLIVIAGCYFVKDLIGTISKWIGAEDALAEGAKVSGKVVSTAGKVAMTALGPAGGAAKFAIGAGKAALAGVAGEGVGTKMGGKRSIKKGEKLQAKADKLDKKGRNKDGTLKKGHKLSEVVRLRAEGQQRIDAGKEKVAEGKGIIKQRRKEGVATMGETVTSPFKRIAAGAGDFRKAVKTSGKPEISGKLFRGAATALGVDPKAIDEAKKDRVKGEKEAAKRKEEQTQAQSAAIKNLDIDKVTANIAAMEGGLQNAVSALGKPGGRTEALDIASSLKEVTAELGAGFEQIADELRNLVHQSTDGTGDDVKSQIGSLISKASEKGDSYSTSVSNIIKTGGDERKIAELDENTKTVLAYLSRAEIERRRDRKNR